MRLTCPNCNAQYEVPPDAIPPEGRDVQCSACSHRWHEPGAAAAPAPEPWDEVPRADDDGEEADDIADVEAAPVLQSPPRPAASPMAIEILRAEAQREARARAEEASARGAPTGPSAEVARIALTDRPPAALPEDGPDAIGAALRRRPPVAEPAPEPAAEPATPAPTPAPALAAVTVAATPRPPRRPERQVDPEAMNATLRPTTERRSDRLAPFDPPRRRRSSFASGFWSALVVLLILAGLYLLRPQIVEALPASATVLDPYAEAVDRGRDWLDGQVESFLTSGLPPEAQPAAAE
ncbi:zinc-ribbon domain-containing protein [Rubellimicrobium roseum]|nr:zinc-ribbon domain-containing protein [Rubellimicrobium roseum]